MKTLQKLIYIFFSFLLIFSNIGFIIAEGKTPQPTTSNTKVVEKTFQWGASEKETLEKVSAWVKTYCPENETILPLGISGEKLDKNVLDKFKSEIKKKGTNYKSLSDISKAALKVTFSGADASNFEGVDLIKLIYDNKSTAKQGVYANVYSLLALDSKKYNVPSKANNSREKIVDEIIKLQNKDGGFSLIKIFPSDVSLTALTVTALSPYKSQQKVSETINRAISFIERKQLPTGGFSEKGKQSIDAICQTIVALNSIGENVYDKKFIKGKNTIVDVLMSYKNKDGGFTNKIGEKSTTSASIQATIALSSLKYKSSPYIYKTVQKEIEAKTKKISSNYSWLYFLGAAVLIIAIAILTLVFLKNKNKK